MGRRKRLQLSVLGLAAAIAFFTAPPTPAFGIERCSADQDLTDTCPSGQLTKDGASVGASAGGTSSSRDPAWVPPEGWFQCGADWLPPERKPLAVCRDVLTVTGPPRPTLNDVREFYPATTQILSEPQGWALKDRHFNPIASTTPVTRTGTVLGIPTEVTFTPVRWNWDYGDGTTATTTAGGATWAQLRQPRFTRTATSHVYGTRGEHTIALDVDYSVTYRFGTGPTRPIDGILTIPADTLPVRVVVGSTVLTDRPCTAGAPSC